MNHTLSVSPVAQRAKSLGRILALGLLTMAFTNCVPDTRNKAVLTCQSGVVSVSRFATYEEDVASGCTSDLFALVSDGATSEESSYYFSVKAKPNGDITDGKSAAIEIEGKTAPVDEADFVFQDANVTHTFTTPGNVGEKINVRFDIGGFFYYGAIYDDPDELGNTLPVDDPSFRDREIAEAKINVGGTEVDLISELANQDNNNDGQPDGARSGRVTLELDAATQYAINQILSVNYVKRGYLWRTQSVIVVLP